MKRWKLSTLTTPPHAHDDAYFYPLSEFAVLKKLTVPPKPLAFPSDLWVSSNHYKQSWSLNTFRRLKNVLVVMEWVPDIAVENQLTRGSGYLTKVGSYSR